MPWIPEGGTCRSGRHAWIPANVRTTASGYRFCLLCAQAPGAARDYRARRHPRLDVSWHDDAACRGEDLNLFFEPGHEDAAREICDGCPVRTQCLEHALTLPERDGVWGGLDEAQRRSERRRRQRSGRAAA